MAETPQDPEMDGLLSQADWLRRLALCLVHSRADADDLVQETWVTAMRSPPETGRPPRGWLATVARNLVRMDARAARRRRAREDEAVGRLDEAPSTQAMLERLELHRMVVGLVKELEEPLRTTVLLRFFEGKPPAAIADAQGVPAGTVRWRISEALRRLRVRLDEAHGGRRDTWRALLVPLAGSTAEGTPPDATPPTPRRLTGTASRWTMLAVGVAATGVVAIWLSRAGRNEASAPAIVPTRAASEQHGPETRPQQNKEAVMKNPGTKAAALFGVVLPALVASAEGSKPLPREEAVAFCIEQREWIWQKCKSEYADLMVERVPPERREAKKQEWLKKLEEGATAPIEQRKQKCGEEIERKTPLAVIFTYAGRDAIRACQKETDCKVAIACGHRYVFGPPPKK